MAYQSTVHDPINVLVHDPGLPDSLADSFNDGSCRELHHTQLTSQQPTATAALLMSQDSTETHEDMNMQTLSMQAQLNQVLTVIV